LHGINILIHTIYSISIISIMEIDVRLLLVKTFVAYFFVGEFHP
jgi:hypothetical protein